MAQFLQIKHAKPHNGKDIANSNHSKIFFGYKSGGVFRKTMETSKCNNNCLFGAGSLVWLIPHAACGDTAMFSQYQPS